MYLPDPVSTTVPGTTLNHAGPRGHRPPRRRQNPPWSEQCVIRCQAPPFQTCSEMPAQEEAMAEVSRNVISEIGDRVTIMRLAPSMPSAAKDTPPKTRTHGSSARKPQHQERPPAKNRTRNRRANHVACRCSGNTASARTHQLHLPAALRTPLHQVVPGSHGDPRGGVRAPASHVSRLRSCVTRNHRHLPPNTAQKEWNMALPAL